MFIAFIAIVTALSSNPEQTYCMDYKPVLSHPNKTQTQAQFLCGSPEVMSNGSKVSRCEWVTVTITSPGAR